MQSSPAQLKDGDIKTIVVLASNSFTGAHFIDYALKHSSARIVGISRSPQYPSILLPYLYRKQVRPDRFSFHQLDVNRDFEKVMDIIDDARPEVILNYSAQGEVRNSWKWPEQWFQTNCQAVVKLANALKDKEYLKRYVHISTPEVYGPTGKKVGENFNYAPTTPYGASKLAGELFLYALYKKQGFPYVATRSANVYGIHQQLYRIIPRTIIYLKLGRMIQLHGGGSAVRSFIHVRDVADATWRVITRSPIGEVYHLAPEEDISIRDVVRLICDMMGYDFEKSTQSIPDYSSQDAIYSLDCAKAREVLGWKPSISLREGIQEMIGWIDENWDEIKNQPLEYVHKE